MRALAKMTLVELKLFKREPITVVFTFAFPLVVLVVLAGVFGNTPDTDDGGSIAWRGVGPTDYYVSAYVALTISAVGLIALPVRMASHRELGVLRRFNASGAPLNVILGAQLAMMLAVTVIGSALLITLGFVGYGMTAPEAPLGVALAFVLVVLSFGAIGLLLGAVLPSSSAAQSVGLVIFFVMMMLSGAGPPREVMGGAMQTVGDALPLTYAITVLQDPWLGFGWDEVGSAILAGIAALCGAGALALFRWD